RVLALIPAANIGEQRITDEATLMECGDDEFKWPGGATVVLSGPFDPDAFVGAVEGHFAAQPEWTVTSEVKDGIPVVEARNAEGLSIFTSVARESTEIWIRSFSVCFPFDPVVGKKY